VPEGIEVDLKDGARMDSSLHRDLVQWCDAQNSKAVYGATLANDNGGGSSSYALGSLHGQVRWENVVGDTVRVQETFSACIAEPFVRFNGWDAAPPRLRLHVVRSLSPLELVQVADTLRNRLGVAISTEQVRHMLGFLAPVDDSDAIPGLADPTETALANPAQAGATGALGGALSP
jgi:phage gp29-like protein